MPRRKALWRQAEFKLTYGSEVFVVVRHRRGWFRIPIDAPLERVLWGIASGWQDGEGPRPRQKDPLRPDTRALVRVWENRGEGGEAPSDSPYRPPSEDRQ